MKYNRMPKQATLCLIMGLLLVTLTPIINTRLAIPDFAKGFLTGLGLTLEFIALVNIQRSKKENQRCQVFPVLKKIG